MKKENGCRLTYPTAKASLPKGNNNHREKKLKHKEYQKTDS